MTSIIASWWHLASIEDPAYIRDPASIGDPASIRPTDLDHRLVLETRLLFETRLLLEVLRYPWSRSVKLVSGWGLRKCEISAALWPCGSGRTLLYFFYIKQNIIHSTDKTMIYRPVRRQRNCCACISLRSRYGCQPKSENRGQTSSRRNSQHRRHAPTLVVLPTQILYSTSWMLSHRWSITHTTMTQCKVVTQNAKVVP